jgi:hypothetical protein
MTALAVNDVVASVDKQQRGRLSFVAIGKSRLLYGISSRQLTEQVVKDARLAHGKGKTARVFPGRSPENAQAATQLVGAFKFDYGQDFEIDKVPLVAVSPFDALGREATVFGMTGGPHFTVEGMNVTLYSADSESPMGGFLELRPLQGSLPIDGAPIDGALVVDRNGRGVGMLIGRSSDKYFAIALEDCLKELELKPVGASHYLDTSSQSIPDEIDAEVKKSMQHEVRHQPLGQLAEIINEPHGELVDG